MCFYFPISQVKMAWCKINRETYKQTYQIKFEQKKGPAYKLTKHHEFLIKLMKIRLRLLNEDIAD